jgi:uncharacterized membrane protein
MDMADCSRCGVENPENAKFCNQCGTQLIFHFSQQLSSTRPRDIYAKKHKATMREGQRASIMMLIVMMISMLAVVLSIESYSPLKINPMTLFFGIIIAIISLGWFKLSGYAKGTKARREEMFSRFIITHEKLVEVLTDIKNILDNPETNQEETVKKIKK